MAKHESTGEKLGHLIGDVFGFFWYVAILCGAYGIGAWVARYFLGESHKETVGFLAALAGFSMTDRQNAQHLWERMNERFDGLYERLPG